MCEFGVGCDAQDGLAEAVDAVCRFFKFRGKLIIFGASDYDLRWMMRKESCGKTVGSGVKAILRRNARESFQRFLREIVGAVGASESVETDQRDDGRGISAGSRRILKRLAANIKTSHRRGVRRTIEEASAFGVGVLLQSNIHRALSSFEVARVQRGLVSVKQR